MEETKLPIPLTTLRPHHTLCALFFEGKGYSQGFVENMWAVVGDPGQNVRITSGCDVLCQACLHNENGLCDDEAKVARFDERTLRHVDSLIDHDKPIHLSNLCQVVYDSILREDLLEKVCGECEWAALCQGKWQRGDFNRQLLATDPENAG
jgi:hypothetical protein